MSSAVQLPRWRSHKIVWADKITGMLDGPYRWRLLCGGLVDVSAQLDGRVPDGVEAVGGYYVRYPDGFESWSPAAAFEDGYTKHEGNAV